MTAALKSHTRGRTLVLTISGPEHRNALGPDIYAAGVEALNAADSARELRAVVLTGEGMHFCSGGHLERLLQHRGGALDEQPADVDGLHSLVEAIRCLSKPVIAAVEGACAGAGLSLALACDLVVAADNARFVTAFAQTGLTPDGGASWHLGRALPRAAQMAWLLLDDPVDASTLQSWGLINRVCAPGTALDHALDLATRLEHLAPNALAATKELSNEAPQRSLAEQLRLERQHFVHSLQHPNGAEGIRAFLDKRAPAFR